MIPEQPISFVSRISIFNFNYLPSSALPLQPFRLLNHFAVRSEGRREEPMKRASREEQRKEQRGGERSSPTSAERNCARGRESSPLSPSVIPCPPRSPPFHFVAVLRVSWRVSTTARGQIDCASPSAKRFLSLLVVSNALTTSCV